jgi:hypothetical protein
MWTDNAGYYAFICFLTRLHFVRFSGGVYPIGLLFVYGVGKGQPCASGLANQLRIAKLCKGTLKPITSFDHITFDVIRRGFQWDLWIYHYGISVGGKIPPGHPYLRTRLLRPVIK